MSEPKYIEVGGRIHSIATGNVTTGANEIFDDDKNKKQNEINTETYSLVNNINERLNSLSPDQQSALNVATKATNNETKLGYYVCDTENNVAAKVISNATGYILSNGGSIKIKMTNANTANDATLNINSTGPKPLYYDGERVSANNSWMAGETVEVYYDGTSYYANNVTGSSGSGDDAFDVSVKYPTSGIEGGNTYTLQGALAVLNTNLSANKKKGGMSIKFIQSSDNKYVQYRLMADEWSTTVADWQGVDDEPTAGSDNLVKSGGVKNSTESILYGLNSSMNETNLDIFCLSQYEITETGYIACAPYNEPINPDSIVATTDFLHKVIDCVAGDLFFISGLGGGTPRLYAFIDSNGSLCGEEDSGYASENKLANELKLVAPAGSSKLIVNFNINNHPDNNYLKYIDKTKSKIEQISEYIENLDESSVKTVSQELTDNEKEIARQNIGAVDESVIYDNIKEWQSIQVSETGYIACAPYSEPINPNNVQQTTAFLHKVVDCTNGDIFKISGLGGGTPRLFAFIDNSGALCGNEDSGYASENKLANDLTITAPNGAVKLIVNYNIDNHPEGNKLEKYAESIKISKLNKGVKYKYIPTDNELLVASIKGGKGYVYQLKRNPSYNHLFDFWGYYTISIEDFENCDFSNMTLLYSAASDKHAPFIVLAKTNIDGDYSGNDHYTGGTHDYSNGQGTGTPTARQLSLEILVDGFAINLNTGIQGDARSITIKWVNNVQGSNTKKQDGTGREILSERHYMRFNGIRWDEEVELVPLEQIQVLVWYATQLIGTANYWKYIRYYGAVNRLTNIGTTASNCGGKRCDEVCAFVNDDCSGDFLKMGIVNNFDLGTRVLLVGSGIGADVRSYGKAYMNIINDVTMEQGYHYNLKCYWELGII